jgi:hypothetical protein
VPAGRRDADIRADMRSDIRPWPATKASSRAAAGWPSLNVFGGGTNVCVMTLIEPVIRVYVIVFAPPGCVARGGAEALGDPMCTIAGQRVAEDLPGRAGRPARRLDSPPPSVAPQHSRVANRRPRERGARATGTVAPAREGKTPATAAPTRLLRQRWRTAFPCTPIEPDMCRYVSHFGGLGGASRGDVGPPHVGLWGPFPWHGLAGDRA